MVVEILGVINGVVNGIMAGTEVAGIMARVVGPVPSVVSQCKLVVLYRTVAVVDEDGK